MPRPLPCPDRCNALLVGGGGREHALGWKLRQSPRLSRLWLTEATNAGLAELGESCPVELNLAHPFHLQRWCDRNEIHLVIVGPEAPLAAGIADVLQTDRRLVFGPSKAGAQIEADKTWAKALLRRIAVPTAEGQVFNDSDAAKQFVEAREQPVVVKASGLAAGKGVTVCDTVEEALAAIDAAMIERVFGDAGERIIIEEKLNGQEVSVLALTDAKTIWVLDPCQDHKQLGEGDTGPNTGGMGAYCPTPLVDEPMMDRIERDILVPTIDGLKREGIIYRGVLYAGLMLTPGGPKVLEFNCRFGDPECQTLMARLESDLLEVLWATAAGTLADVDVRFDQRTACTVVMCSAGYPGPYEKGKAIRGVDEAEAIDDIIVFHSGTKRNESGELLTNGGRVLGVTALADDLLTARDRANAACEKIGFDGAFFRHDIGERVLVRL